MYYLMTSGLRMSVKPDLNDSDDKNDSQETDSPYFDRSFSRIANFIKIVEKKQIDLQIKWE